MDNLTLEATNIVWHRHAVSRQSRSQIKGHQACVLWFTGLSGSGKSTIANRVDAFLNQQQVHSYLLDGDNIRHGLNADLGFCEQDRTENIRRISEVSRLFFDAGLVVLTAFISPFLADRARARSKYDNGQFLEVFIDTSLEECEQRDPKGLYKKARLGEIANFSGIDSAYQPPVNPEIHIKTKGKSVDDCALEVIQALINRKIITLDTIDAVF